MNLFSNHIDSILALQSARDLNLLSSDFITIQVCKNLPEAMDIVSYTNEMAEDDAKGFRVLINKARKLIREIDEEG